MHSNGTALDGNKALTILEMGIKMIRILVFVIFISAMGNIHASDVTIPNTFVPFTPAKADEVNANFTAVESAVDDNDARIDGLEAADLINRITALEAAPKANIAVAAPTINDDINSGFTIGSVWVDTTDKEAYILVDNSAGAAVWKRVSNNYAIGDTGPAGGFVFYITDNGLHGLEVAPTILSAVNWGCSGTDLTGANGTAVGTGAQNTIDILAGCTESGIAAELASAYSISGESGWHLPSGDELSLLYFGKDYLGKNYVGGFPDQDFWSSSELDGNIANALCQNISTGATGNCLKTGSRRVLPIRAF